MQSKWDERYRQNGLFYGIEPNSFLMEQSSRFEPQSRILSLGEGEGRNAIYLARLGHRVTALDQSAYGLAKLTRQAQDKGLEIDIVVADLSEYEFAADQWDAVISIWCHLPSQLRAKVYPQVYQSLHNHGLFIMESYTPDQIARDTGGPKDADMLLTADQARRELNDFTIIDSREVEREVIEGIGHTGLSSVLQVVARKN